MRKGLPMALMLCLMGLPCAAQDGAGGGPVNGGGSPGAGMPVSDQGQQQPGQADQQAQPDQQGQSAQQGQLDQPQQPGGETGQAAEGDDSNSYNPEEMAPSAENPAAPAASPKPAAPAPDAGQSVAPAPDQASAAAPAKNKRHGKAKAKAAEKPVDDSSASKTAVAKSDIPAVPLTPVTPSNP
jgi:hypothetical protein